MKVLSKTIEKSQALLTIELEPAEVEKSLDKSYRRLVKKTDIPGFRKGKAPRVVLERHIGKESLLEDALNSLLPEACASAIAEQEIEAIARPVIKLTQTEPVVFEATVPLPPTVKLADYSRIRMKPEKVKIEKEEIDTVVEQLRHQCATWEPVERPVALKDLVVIDVKSTVEEKPFIDEKGAHYQLAAGNPFPAPGFTEQLVGMKRDEEKDFRLKIPEKHPNSALAGKEVPFWVKVVEVKEEKLPELSDDFAKRVGPGLESMSLLRKRISDDLKNRAEEKARADFEQKLIDTLVEKSELEFPPVLVDMELDRMVNQYLERLRANATSPEEYIQWLKRKSEAELRQEYQPLATKRVAGSLVLSKVAEAEKIEVSDAEVDTEIELMAKNAGDKKDEQKKFLNSPQARSSIRQMLATRKTIQRLSEIAKGSKKERTKKEVK